MNTVRRDFGLIDYGVDLYIRNCTILPSLVNSGGIWDSIPAAPRIFTASLQVLELQIITIFALTHLIHSFLRIKGTPILVSQLLAGLILGPTAVGEVEEAKGFFFPDKASLQVFDTLAMFGIVLFMFLVGVKTNLRLLSKAGKIAVGIAILPRVLSFVAIELLISFWRPHDLYKSDAAAWNISWTEQMAFAFSQGPTSLAVIVYLLCELRMLNSKLGRLAVSWALVSHFCDTFVTIASSFFVSPKIALLMVLLVIFMFFVVRPVMHWMVRIMPKDQPVQEWVIPFIILLALTFAYCPQLVQINPIFGVFLFGLVLPEGPPLGSVLELKVEPLVTGILLPLFTVSTTMRLCPWDILFQPEQAELAMKISLACFLVKFFSTFLPSLILIKMHWKDALVVSLILCSKGFTELVYYISFKDGKVIFGGVYAVGVMGVIFNSSILPITIKSLYDSIRERDGVAVKRSMVNLKHNSELKILVCVHGPDDVAPMISFLKATHPTQENPLDLYLLHLKHMVGSNSPIFLVHDMQETKSGFVMNFFEDVILPFYQLEQELHGFVTMNAFTAISPPKAMDEDICTLAINKQTSLVLLPFHRKWYSCGLIESESSVVRNLNCSILNRASCSVGILMHHPDTRERLHSLTFFSLCVLFFGGKDDREALALATRMAEHPRVSLTVIHFTSNEEIPVSMNWDKILDIEALKEVRINNGDQKNNVSYMDQKVNDGPETMLLIRKFVNKYDLIVVGRRYRLECTQTSGLLELVEFPELGIVGDFLASTDVDCRTSTLIVQQ